MTESKPADGDYPTWDSSKTYLLGDRVTYKGKNYEAKWWAGELDVPGEGTNSPWKELVPPGTIPEWSADQNYPADSIVTYNDRIYKAKWWANAGDMPGKEPWIDITDISR
ncbi:carbohydrate-binding protein [Listeria sp. PSOL-1]|uniref:carbohydrate-binding protein n=1 Tax=Listeria sp. PSOL-1 TaxID=1844999 RepID=UPI00351B813E